MPATLTDQDPDERDRHDQDLHAQGHRDQDPDEQGPRDEDARGHRAPDSPPPGRGDHYFSAEPASTAQLRELTVPLAGALRTVLTAPGVFSSGHVDLGTQVLLRSVPTPPADGDLVDLGCGWGPIALTLALRSPGATVWAVDVNARALDLVRRNAERLGLTGLRAVTPDEVPESLRWDALWSNPPIRVGKAALHAMLRTWLGRGAPGAQAHLVVQRNLGADSLHRWLATELEGRAQVHRAASAKGFRVLEVALAPDNPAERDGA